MEILDGDKYKGVSPTTYRYIPSDENLLEKLNEYKDLDVLKKLNRIVPEIVVPRLKSLEKELLDIGNKAEGKFPRRIDGQHNGTITVKKLFSDYGNRLKKRTRDIQKVPLNLDKVKKEYERNDRLSDLTYSSLSAFSVEANIANDIRNQFREEIGEYGREYRIDRVGSSAMPHKVNPFEYENIVSLWKHYLHSIFPALMSQIVESQGDSTNNGRADYTFELTCALSYSTQKLKNSLRELQINAK